MNAQLASGAPRLMSPARATAIFVAVSATVGTLQAQPLQSPQARAGEAAMVAAAPAAESEASSSEVALLVGRSTLLTAPVHSEDRIVLVASKGGDDRNPLWYENLRANPDVEITIDGTTRAMRARTASPEEKAELWPQITSAYKGYAGYQKRTTREIPVVICEARPGE